MTISKLLASIIIGTSIFLSACGGKSSFKPDETDGIIQDDTFQEESDEMTFSRSWNGGNCKSCSWVSAQGKITKNTPEIFEEFLKTRDIYPGERIVLDSLGGDLFSGIFLGLRFRELELTTSVGKTIEHPEEDQFYETRTSDIDKGVCLSACAYAFLGGKDRELLFEKSLGFHQFYRSLTSEQVIKLIERRELQSTLEGDTQIISGLLIEYLTKLEMNPQILTIASRAGPENMYFPSKEEFEALNILSSEGLGHWNLGLVNEGVVLSADEADNSADLDKAYLYCRKSDKARILMLGSGKKINSISNEIKFYTNQSAYDTMEFSIDGIREQIEKGRIEYVQSPTDDNWYQLYRILLNDENVNQLISGNSIGASVWWSNAAGNHFFNSKIDETFRKKIKLAFRNCI